MRSGKILDKDSPTTFWVNLKNEIYLKGRIVTPIGKPKDILVFSTAFIWVNNEVPMGCMPVYVSIHSHALLAKFKFKVR